jgi:hypothetical protein
MPQLRGNEPILGLNNVVFLLYSFYFEGRENLC